MGNKRRNKTLRHLLLALMLLCATRVCAKSVTVQVLQSGAIDNVCEETFVIEDAVMNTMFDMGHIVTNLDAALSARTASAPAGKIGSALSKAMNNALAGGSRYFVQLTVRYKALVGSGSPKSPEAVLMDNIEGIDWAVYDAMGREMLCTGSEKATVPKKDGLDSVASYASDVAKNVCACIR